jgi:hypothetical protein
MIGHECSSPFCVHFYIGKDLTHITNPQPLMHRGWPGLYTDLETDPQNPSRAVGSIGMISSCRIILLDVQDFILLFFLDISPFQEY